MMSGMMSGIMSGMMSSLMTGMMSGMMIGMMSSLMSGMMSDMMSSMNKFPSCKLSHLLYHVERKRSLTFFPLLITVFYFTVMICSWKPRWSEEYEYFFFSHV